jgi:ribosomal protein S12 methylthiotransferase accessory factor
VQHKQQGFTLVTTAADFAADAAVESALSEAEISMVKMRSMGMPKVTRLQNVRTPSGHGAVYAMRSHFRAADFLRRGRTLRRFSEMGGDAAKSWADLKSRLRRDGYRVVGVDLTPPGASINQGRTALHVMRAVVPGLIPIWFGYGAEPRGLPRFQAAAGKAGTFSARPEPSRYVHPFQ